VTLTPTLVAREATERLLEAVPVDDPLVRQWVAPFVLQSLDSRDSWVAKVRADSGQRAFYVGRARQARAAFRRASAAGVTIIAGTDAGSAEVFHGPALIRELELLVHDGGLTPAQAIAAATGVAAQRLGRSEVGRIAPGAFADLVVLDADPEKDISAVRRVHAVYFRGAILDRAALLTTNAGSWQPTFSVPEPKTVSPK